MKNSWMCVKIMFTVQILKKKLQCPLPRQNHGKAKAIIAPLCDPYVEYCRDGVNFRSFSQYWKHMGCKVSVRNIMRNTALHTDSMDAALLYDSVSFQKDTYTWDASTILSWKSFLIISLFSTRCLYSSAKWKKRKIMMNDNQGQFTFFF